MKLNTGQQNALNAVVAAWGKKHREIRMSGPAGTGKTMLIRALLDELDGQDIVVVTPTNKAAAVLNRKGVKAATLYAKFFTSSQELNPLPSEAEIARMRADGMTEDQLQNLLREKRNDRKKLTFYPNHELKTVGDGKRQWADTIIVDEASMVQAWVLGHLRKMCTTLILVGDQHQLPPVNDKLMPDGYFVTQDAHAELTEVMRQAGDSPILELASAIRDNKFPDALVRRLGPTVPFEQWVREQPSRKIIAFTNAHRREINMLVRRIRGLHGVVPKAGETLICNSNIDSGLLNGTEVRVVSFDWPFEVDQASKVVSGPPTGRLSYVSETGDMGSLLVNMGRFLEDLAPEALAGWNLDKTIAVSRDLDEGAFFSYGYCITAHKAQGSEWDEVCVIDERFVLGKVDPTGNTCRRWIYTAITRAAKTLVFADYRWVKPSASRRSA